MKPQQNEEQKFLSVRQKLVVRTQQFIDKNNLTLFFRILSFLKQKYTQPEDLDFLNKLQGFFASPFTTKQSVTPNVFNSSNLKLLYEILTNSLLYLPML